MQDAPCEQAHGHKDTTNDAHQGTQEDEKVVSAFDVMHCQRREVVAHRKSWQHRHTAAHQRLRLHGMIDDRQLVRILSPQNRFMDRWYQLDLQILDRDATVRIVDHVRALLQRHGFRLREWSPELDGMDVMRYVVRIPQLLIDLILIAFQFLCQHHDLLRRMHPRPLRHGYRDLPTDDRDAQSGLEGATGKLLCRIVSVYGIDFDGIRTPLFDACRSSWFEVMHAGCRAVQSQFQFVAGQVREGDMEFQRNLALRVVLSRFEWIWLSWQEWDWLTLRQMQGMPRAAYNVEIYLCHEQQCRRRSCDYCDGTADCRFGLQVLAWFGEHIFL
mmetsp:Transcript_1441/g.3544  ORF Transcript_1441/g.3544 Transcript_1441/m.3544 type:complete len:329 (+) Transcript_1441:192-1178(+)